MKRWTVMVIPQGRGGSQTHHVSSIHLWMVYGCVALLAITAFSSAFLFKRYRLAQHDVKQLQQDKLETEYAGVDTVIVPVLSEEQRAELEQTIREEYERRNAAILAELGELYEVESQVRNIHGLPPREDTANGVGATGGRGGGPSSLDGADADDTFTVVRPPSFIYGMSKPSADLMVEEILLRKESLAALLKSMEDKSDAISRQPSIWPTNHGSRKITSRYGNRRDPFTRKLRHHSGTDISAQHGTPVVATANGTVKVAHYERALGNVVKIDHGEGVETWYGHMTSMSVKKGDVVERGQAIGKVGSTGRSTGAHIHYEVHVNNRPVDSGKYLGNY
jgi:murein DD-endopeptidase MepM/ murein hydrolase activator NlpD